MELVLDNISFDIIDIDKEKVSIINQLNMTIKEGEIVTFFGRSGCGKSTLMRIIGGLEPPTSGTVKFEKEDDTNIKIGFVFQEAALLPFKTVKENVEFSLMLDGISDKKQRSHLAEEALKKVGLEDHKDKYPYRDKISGGMKQRVEIAAALAIKADILLMDEPFSALDDITREDMQAFLLEVWRDIGCTVLFVTHNKEEALKLSDRILLMPHSPSTQEYKLMSISDLRPRQEDDIDFFKYKDVLKQHLNS